ncbi:c-type cytochrome [Nitrospira sp. T9]|uniref:c-type cytochrome n=1 Tax=unclassified Nitrospira TaxID=2652172 RepID=UPI003F94DD91
MNLLKENLKIVLAFFVTGIIGMGLVHAADLEVLKPRVPPEQIQDARAKKNPFLSTSENIEKGKKVFHGKAFCVTCHGPEGKGLGDIPGLRGRLPRNFTDKTWQAARTDGELFWILQNGSPGTDMASFIPLVLTEDEAWLVILYVRSFGTGTVSSGK